MSIITLIIITSVSGIIIFAAKKAGKSKVSWMQFYAKGKEAGFSNANIRLLKDLAQRSGIEHPAALFWSQARMDDCIKKFIHGIKQKKTEFTSENQEFLAKLYDFRKKMEMNRPIYKNGLTSSRHIDPLQSVQVVVANTGVFKSKVVNNTSAFISIERPNISALPVNFSWKQKRVSLYFWRKSDAGYCLETNVIDEVFINDPPLLTLSHSDNLIRTQSRKSLRVKTRRPAILYSVDDGAPTLKPELTPGVKCEMEDISDSGCAVIIRGMFSQSRRVIVQFVIDSTPLSIGGVVRGIEYDEEKQKSLLHIESDLIPVSVKNKIFSVMFGMIDDDIIQIGGGPEEIVQNPKPEDSEASNGPADGDVSAPANTDAYVFDFNWSEAGEKAERNDDGNKFAAFN
jgi:hypothetical protein